MTRNERQELLEKLLAVAQAAVAEDEEAAKIVKRFCDDGCVPTVEVFVSVLPMREADPDPTPEEVKATLERIK